MSTHSNVPWQIVFTHKAAPFWALALCRAGSIASSLVSCVRLPATATLMSTSVQAVHVRTQQLAPIQRMWFPSHWTRTGVLVPPDLQMVSANTTSSRNIHSNALSWTPETVRTVMSLALEVWFLVPMPAYLHQVPCVTCLRR